MSASRSRARPRVRSRTAKRSVATAQHPRRPSPAEAALLDLARSLAATAAPPAPTDALTTALSRLESAFSAGAALPRQLAQSWLRTRGDKTALLALGWAREQVRRALSEILQHEGQGGAVRAHVPAETLAWLFLAAAEASAHEPGGTVGDRLTMVRDLLCRPGP